MTNFVRHEEERNMINSDRLFWSFSFYIENYLLPVYPNYVEKRANTIKSERIISPLVICSQNPGESTLSHY